MVQNLLHSSMTVTLPVEDAAEGWERIGWSAPQGSTGHMQMPAGCRHHERLLQAAAGQARPAAAAGAATAALQRASPGILEHITPKEPEPVP